MAGHRHPVIWSIQFGVLFIQMFNLSEDVRKIKTKVLILSGISLFIALTQALPQKVAILGLDLSKNETMAGWFILAITAYFLVSFLIFSTIELIKYYLPNIIDRKTKDTTGDVIGLLVEECLQNLIERENGHLAGTTGGELEYINRKNKEISDKYKGFVINFSNTMKLIMDLVFPIVFSFISLGYLYCYLISI